MKKGEITEDVYYTMAKYRFKYVDEMGKERCVYSWRLDHNDATPKGKRRTLSLREMEKKIQVDQFEQIATNGGNMTVLELVEKYTSTRTGVRPTTVAGYRTVLNLLQKDPFGKRCEMLADTPSASRKEKLQFHSFYSRSSSPGISISSR